MKGANKSQLPLDDQRPSISNRKPLNNETIKAGTEANQYPDDLDSITYIECEANEDEKTPATLDSTDSKPNGKYSSFLLFVLFPFFLNLNGAVLVKYKSK